jgi:hypothetical protein
MNEFEEYIRTHGKALLSALVAGKSRAEENNNADDANYYQHELNALIEVIRKLPK